jgi:7,8-dihydroneopterin 2',3'-cyclic phosphate phosphodiesterase
MKMLLPLAKKIKDKNLRKKTIKVISSAFPTHKGFNKETLALELAPASNGWHHAFVNGLILHTYAVTKLCLKIAELLEEIYKKEINYDCLIAAALLHDILKTVMYKYTEKGIEHTDINLDHLTLTVAELYKQEFPREVIEIVAAHHGDVGPVKPHTIEGLILHYADSIDAFCNAEMRETQPIVVLDEAELKKLIEKKVK